MPYQARFPGPHHDDMVAAMHRQLPDRRVAGLPHSLKQQRVRFFSISVRREIIRRFQIPRIDFAEAYEFDDADSAPGPMNAHSVLTVNLIDEPGSKTKLAEERVIAFFRERTGAV